MDRRTVNPCSLRGGEAQLDEVPAQGHPGFRRDCPVVVLAPAAARVPALAMDRKGCANQLPLSQGLNVRRFEVSSQRRRPIRLLLDLTVLRSLAWLSPGTISLDSPRPAVPPFHKFFVPFDSPHAGPPALRCIVGGRPWPRSSEFVDYQYIFACPLFVVDTGSPLRSLAGDRREKGSC